MANNDVANWGPRKPLIVSDPNKLSYFAQAAYTRQGLNAGAAAAVSSSAFAGLRVNGFGAVPMQSYDPAAPNTGGDAPVVGGAGSPMPGGGQTVTDFLSRLSQGVGAFFGQQQQPQYQAPVEREAGPLGIPLGGWILGGIAVVGIGFLVLKK